MPQRTKVKTKCMGDHDYDSDIEYYHEYSTKEMNDTPHIDEKLIKRDKLKESSPKTKKIKNDYFSSEKKKLPFF